MFHYKDENVILKTVMKALIPFAFLLGFYILINGHLSPGGGFSGGTVLGAGLIMHNLAFGQKKTDKFFNFKVFTAITVVGLGLYAILKGASFSVGAAGGSLNIPLGTPGTIFSAGLIPVLNIAVGLVVMSSIYLFFVLFMKGDE